MSLFESEFEEHMVVAAATRAALGPAFRRMLDAWLACIRGGGKILFFGNGGSASDAQHLATELTIRYVKDRAPIAAIALTTDSSALTAAGNDLGFERIFARQIEALGRQGDVAIAISTSGKSANVTAALDLRPLESAWAAHHATSKGAPPVRRRGTRDRRVAPHLV
jgi:D-sedoheptulose 7-phosphate isomerase